MGAFPAGYLTDAAGNPISATTPLQVTGTSTSSGSTTPSDAFANPTNAVTSFSLGAVWNGATWDRASEFSNTDPAAYTGIVSTGIYLSGGTTARRWQVVSSAGGDASGMNNAAPVGPWIYNGASWDRMRAATLGTTAMTSNTGVQAAGIMLAGNADSTPLNRISNAGDADAGTGAARVGPWIYNGTTWDRMGEAIGGTTAQVNATGAVAVGLEIADGFSAGKMRQIFPPANTGDGGGGANSLTTGVVLNNGTTWDRARVGQFTGSTLSSIQPSTATLSETSATTAAGGALTASVAATAAKTSYITGFDVTLGIGAAAASTNVTVTGPANTLNYTATTNTTTGTVLSVRYPVPIPGSAVNTAVTVNLSAVGGGAAVNGVSTYGFVL